jgi:nucleotide-binding universal stress UspA family protein
MKMKIMACFDGSDESTSVLLEAAELAKAFNGEVLVVTSVVADQQYYPKMIEPYEQGLEKAKAFYGERKIPCQTMISYRDVDSNPGEDLVNFASRENVDKIVIGMRKRSRVGKLLLGSKAQWIMLNAECPVVGVRKKS